MTDTSVDRLASALHDAGIHTWPGLSGYDANDVRLHRLDARRILDADPYLVDATPRPGGLCALLLGAAFALAAACAVWVLVGLLS